jgi:hypothetical protein
LRRKVLNLLIAMLGLATLIMSYYYYQAQQQTGIAISFGHSSISVEKK